jgi:hypothetical protein
LMNRKYGRQPILVFDGIHANYQGFAIGLFHVLQPKLKPHFRRTQLQTHATGSSKNFLEQVPSDKPRASNVVSTSFNWLGARLIEKSGCCSRSNAPGVQTVLLLGDGL